MKVFQLAKENGYGSKEVMNRLKEAGIIVKTPMSVIPEHQLLHAKALCPPSAIPKDKMTDVVPVFPEKHVDAPRSDKLKQRSFNMVAAEGFDPRFNQYVMGIRRRIVDGRKSFEVLTVAFDADTLEFKLLNSKPQRTEAQAIMELKSEMLKRKVT